MVDENSASIFHFKTNSNLRRILQIILSKSKYLQLLEGPLKLLTFLKCMGNIYEKRMAFLKYMEWNEMKILPLLVFS